MQYFKFGQKLTNNIYVLSRETNKTVFFKSIKPYKELYKYELRYQFFDLNNTNPIIDEEDDVYRSLKRKCRMIPLNPDEIDKINNSVIFDHDEFQPRENHFLSEYSAEALNEYNNI